jgi:hypothetical protein
VTVLRQVVDLRASIATHRRIVFAVRDLAPGPHVLRVVVGGTSSPRPVAVDAFLVLGD